MEMEKHMRSIAGIVLVFALSACAVGPDYKKPDAVVSASYKEDRGWVSTRGVSRPPQGKWWKIYSDPVLDGLEEKVEKANQSLLASYYAWQQAISLTDFARAAEFPTVGVGAATSTTSSASPVYGGGSVTISGKTVSFSASWAPDFWGKVRRQVESDRANAEASLDNLLASRLSLQSTLAQDYFQIRQLDMQISLARENVAAYEKSVVMTRNRYKAGVATRADVALAESQLAAAKVQAVSFGVQRAQFEHAIAVLIGVPPAQFGLAAKNGIPQPEPIPAGLPSELLLRRPDVAAAERQMAAANAQIGVAESAYFPSLTITGQRGWRSTAFANLFSSPNLFWSVGPSIAETIFDAGARSAQLEQSRAAYRQSVAQYRQTGLQALQQVEDQMAALSILSEEDRLQKDAVEAAENSYRVSLDQYHAGTIPYLNVITAQTAWYASRNSALLIAGQRLVADVALIQALGGGWEPATGPDGRKGK